MKSYPSIPRSRGQSFRAIPNAVVFDKIDGSNVRVEWAGKKKGWTKFGTRDRLLDPNDPVFGVVPVIFNQQWEEPLTRIAVDQRWERGVFFFEFWGPNSFAGNHDPSDPKCLTLIDVAPHRVGIIGLLHIIDGHDGIMGIDGVRARMQLPMRVARSASELGLVELDGEDMTCRITTLGSQAISVVDGVRRYGA